MKFIYNKDVSNIIMDSRKLKFASEQEYRTYRGDTKFWHEVVNKLLQENKLVSNFCDIEAGYNPTYPVFLTDKYVVKFFGYRRNWLEVFNAELAAHETLALDNSILAPVTLAKGHLFDDKNEYWPYIISTRIQGDSWLDTELTYKNKEIIASEIGRQLERIHKLPIDTNFDNKWPSLNFKDAASKSILPAHLIAQVEDFVIGLDDFDKRFVNGDVVSNHVFINNGHLSGIIDWGDATVTDRHYELGKLMDTFDWDKNLLKIFLEASDWPIKKNFPNQALGLALYRQAVGLTQHNTFDVFYKLPNLINLENINTLDDLALTLFEI